MLQFKIFLVIAVLQVQAMSQTSSHAQNLNMNAKRLETINGTLYYISSPEIKATMAAALRVCKELDMNILSLQTSQKSKMISDYLQSNGRVNYYYWTSGVRLYGKASSSTFVWFALGDLIDHTSWYTDEPDDLDAQNVCIYFGDVNGVYWWDTDCDTGEFGIICEEKPKCR